MAVQTVAKTDVGQKRDHNEDSVLTASVSGGTLLAVADGMGGHNAGDVASETALESLVEHVEDALGDRPTETALAQAVEAADADVRAAAASDPGRAGMGTTLVAALVDDDGATVVNVGDSRAYRVGANSIDQVTVDHSLVRQLVEAGEITEAEAAVHPRRNVVSQALGASDSIDPDVCTPPFDAGETLLLCSDGLTGEVDESTTQEVVSGFDSLEAVAGELVATANENGGSDNISVVLCRRD